MIRRSVIILTVAALGFGTFVVRDVSTFAAGLIGFTNIGVGVSNGTAQYLLCLRDPGFGPPGVGGVTISGPSGQVQARLVGTPYVCAEGSTAVGYEVAATFNNLPSGNYTFDAAIIQGADGVPYGLTPGSSFEPNFSGLTVETTCQVNFTVSPDSPTGRPQGCNGGGAFGTFNAIPLPPTPTSTPPPPTSTPPPPTSTPPLPPLPTSTSQPANTPQPTSTTGTGSPPPATATTGSSGGGQSSPTPPAGSGTGSGTGGTPTSTATTPPITVVVSSSPGDTATSGQATSSSTSGSGNTSGGSSTSNGGSSTSNGGSSSNHGTAGVSKAAAGKHQPAHPTKAAPGKRRPAPHAAALPLSATVLSSLVAPGETARIAVTSAPDTLIQVRVAYPRGMTVTQFGVTDLHGHLTLSVQVPRNVAVRDGHATAVVSVQAMAGAWHAQPTFSAAVRPSSRPGAVEHIVISAPKNAGLRATVTLPGRAPLAFFGTADGNGRYVLSLTVPRSVKLQHGAAIARVAVATLTPSRRATAKKSLAISDLIMNVVGNAIVKCAQTQTVHVRYHPNVSLKILVLFANGLQIVLNARTDALGDATSPVKLSYVKADNPVQITVAAVDETPHVSRMEQTLINVSLPPACQRSGIDANVTVGS